jgi:hypothetical protein
VPKWKKRSQFIAKLKTPRGFRNDPPDEDAQSRPVFKYVPYTDYLGADGVFDPRGFIDGFREAARVLVAMEKAINKILEHLAWKLIRAALRLWWREL